MIADGRYTIRPATTADSDFLYSLSSDPRIRATNTRQDEFTLEEHGRWYADKLAHPDRCRIWIMEVRDIPVGQVRYGRVLPAPNDCGCGDCGVCDRAGCADRGSAEIAISIAPLEQHRGLGSELLHVTLPLARAWLGVGTFVALVLRQNYPSRAFFRRAGFRYVGPEKRLDRWHARYEVSA